MSEKSTKTVTIVVNGREKEVARDTLSFAEIVTLAFGAPTDGAKTAYTVTFKRGHGNKPEGSLVEGESVEVKDGMIFNVTRTDKS
jgi:hypothetical protein